MLFACLFVELFNLLEMFLSNSYLILLMSSSLLFVYHFDVFVPLQFLLVVAKRDKTGKKISDLH